MSYITYKLKDLVVKAKGVLATGLLLTLLFVPSTALAANSSSSSKDNLKTYAIDCKPGGVAAASDSAGQLSCPDAKSNPHIVATGANASDKISDSSVLVITVDCGSSTVAKNYKTGDTPSSLKCKHGTPNVKIISASAQLGCSNSNCEDPAANPKLKCTFDNCDFIGKYINPGINLLTISFGLIAVGSIILGGIQYSSSEGDPQQASKAKSRIANTIIAVIVYFFLYGFLQFLIPGGIFH